MENNCKSITERGLCLICLFFFSSIMFLADMFTNVPQLKWTVNFTTSHFERLCVMLFGFGYSVICCLSCYQFGQ